MSFAAQRLRVLKANDLNPDRFAETCTYTPVSGGVAREVVCKVAEASRGESAEQTADQHQRIEVMCLKDPLDADKGGIADPSIGDTLTWSGGTYTFGGEIANGGTFHHVLIFTRKTRAAQGRRR